MEPLDISIEAWVAISIALQIITAALAIGARRPPAKRRTIKPTKRKATRTVTFYL